MSLLDEATEAGAREERACEVIGIEPRTVQRWRKEGGGEDKRQGPKTKPRNALSAEERAGIVETANSVEYRDMSPKQIVPRLADKGVYIGSEASFYRVLHEAGQMVHRGRAKAPEKREVPSHVANGPNQVWVWDITYVSTVVRGVFYYLYLMLDLYSRKVVGWEVYEVESMQLSSELLDASVKREGADGKKLVLHADNGGPMKGSTMLAKMQQLGVIPSFSRPMVSDDNAYAESFFRHLKYAPSWPKKPFATIELARAWVQTFVTWYNTEHRHSGIQFVTPSERHEGQDGEVLAARKEVYEQAKERHPERWSGETRDWTPVAEVALTPGAKKGGHRASLKSQAKEAVVSSSRRRRRPPFARTSPPHRAQGGSRAAKPAREAREPLTRPSTVGSSPSRKGSSAMLGQATAQGEEDR